MSLKKQILFSVLSVVIALAANASDTTPTEVLKNYMYIRLNEYFLVHNTKKPEGGLTFTPLKPGAVLTLDEAQRLWEKNTNPIGKFISGSLNCELDTTDDLISGWNLKGTKIDVFVATMGLNTSAPTLFCVRDGEKIYELSNENGFQKDPALEWYSCKSRVKQKDKAKIIVGAIYSSCAYGAIAGYLTRAGDFDLLCKSLQKELKDEAIDKEDIEWIASQKSTYCAKNQEYLYFYATGPFPSLQRIAIDGQTIKIEIKYRQGPDEWKAYVPCNNADAS